MFERFLKIWSEEIIFLTRKQLLGDWFFLSNKIEATSSKGPCEKSEKCQKNPPKKSSKWVKTIDPKITQLSSICFNLVAHFQEAPQDVASLKNADSYWCTCCMLKYLWSCLVFRAISKKETKICYLCAKYLILGITDWEAGLVIVALLLTHGRPYN